MSGYMDLKGRKPHAVEDLRTIHECAEKAGISHALFINFGLLLGICREHDFIGHDNDVDMCVLADKITPDQELRYFEELKKADMFASRERHSFKKSLSGWNESRYYEIVNKEKPVDGPRVRFTWFTLRRKRENAKFCHWFMFAWGGYYWWSKSREWVKDKKFKKKDWKYDAKDDGIMLGIPQNYIEELKQIKFYGMTVNIPRNKGSVLDWEYPNWIVPKQGGSSKKNVVCVVKNWHDCNTWKIRKH